MTFVTTISGVGNLISAQYPTCGFTVGIVSGDIILASRWAKSGLVLAPTPYTSLPSPGSLVSNHFPTPAKNQSDPRGGCPVWCRPNPILPGLFPRSASMKHNFQVPLCCDSEEAASLESPRLLAGELKCSSLLTPPNDPSRSPLTNSMSIVTLAPAYTSCQASTSKFALELGPCIRSYYISLALVLGNLGEYSLLYWLMEVALKRVRAEHRVALVHSSRLNLGSGGRSGNVSGR